MRKPCETCTKVSNPKECERKSCETWRQWFIANWEEMRSRFGFRKEK